MAQHSTPPPFIIQPSVRSSPFPLSRLAEKRVRDENRRVEESLKERAMQQTMAKENAREAHDKHRQHFINTLDSINKEKVGVDRVVIGQSWL